MKRIVSVWLPQLPLDRIFLRQSRQSCDLPYDLDRPLAIVGDNAKGLRITHVNRAAEQAGIGMGQPLADAFALLPSLKTHPADPQRDRRLLNRLADWCTRYTPWSNVDGADGLWLDITGCAHLFGGETALAQDLSDRLSGLGFTARIGIADTPGAAWAMARFHRCKQTEKRIVPRGGAKQALAPLPVEALRISAADSLLLRRLGVKTIAQLMGLPRASLPRRFPGSGEEQSVLTRLDQALGGKSEPVSPLRPPPAYRTRLIFAEPLLETAGYRKILDHLLATLCTSLQKDGQGIRQACLSAYHGDGRTSHVCIGTARPSRDPDHLAVLFRDRLEQIDPGFGIDLFILAATRTEALQDRQLTLAQMSLAQAPDAQAPEAEQALGHLIDRLSNHPGITSVHRTAFRQSHIPERAVQPADAVTSPDHPAASPVPARPLRLLDRPERIEAVAEVPDGPPVMFRWRRVLHRVARARGPERILPEWWRQIGNHEEVRDYYDVEDAGGRRFWLFRSGLYQDAAVRGEPVWHMHGLFA